jgi:hypothetical protein
VGLGRYLRRHVAVPIVERLDMQGQLLLEMHLQQLLQAPPYDASKRLERHGLRAFSQNDEDGILQEIFRRIGTGDKTFVEFGVQDGLQNNTRLLLYQGWRGLWIEADANACRSMRRSFAAEIASGKLQVCQSLVTAENITGLIDAARLGDIDLLSIDIDGNDYWIWEAVSLKPKVLVIEYNAKFPPPTKWVMQYNPQHRWDYTDYQGASLESLTELSRSKGYTLVGCCLAGVNAFFVRDDLVRDRFAQPDTRALYNQPRYYLQRFLASGHPSGPFGPYESR